MLFLLQFAWICACISSFGAWPLLCSSEFMRSSVMGNFVFRLTVLASLESPRSSCFRFVSGSGVCDLSGDGVVVDLDCVIISPVFHLRLGGPDVFVLALLFAFAFATTVETFFLRAMVR